jgi:RNA polymerase sigma factor (sigma-70 family)
LKVRWVTFTLPCHQMPSPEKDTLTIVNQIKEQGSHALSGLYVEYRAEFIQWMKRHLGCDVEVAKDIYQQCILVFYENVLNGKLKELTSSPKTYLFSIGRNKYYEFMRQQEREKAFASTEPSDETAEPLLQQVETCLEKLGEPCRTLLMQFYYHKRNLEQLTHLFNYKNIDTTKNQKYKCLERLRKLVKANGQFTASTDTE